MSTDRGERRQNLTRKRVSNACHRCRQQKIRCSGRIPCEQCSKRNLQCSFGDRASKVLVSREFLQDLERRAEAAQLAQQSQALSGHASSFSFDQPLGQQPNNAGQLDFAAPSHEEDRDTNVDDARSDASEDNGHDLNAGPPHVSFADRNSASDSGRATPSAQLINPFSSHAPRYITDFTGRQWYLGTSSNWAFTRRVLLMAYSRLLGQPAPLEFTLSPEGTQYELGWDGQRDIVVAETMLLPSIDYALYLINAVKFHCAQIFHLWDETHFMRHFYDFYGPSTSAPNRGLWYVHFLIILAFGKIFVARKNEGRRPLGAEYFVQAMKLMPDITFLHTQPVEAIEVLCCKALYLQCLDYRCAAYSVIGEAVRLALAEGMHTNMQVEGLTEQHVQRCRNVWWTVYVLDRQMSSLMGVPIAVKDDDISAYLPTFSGSLLKSQALELNVKLSGIIAQILNTVYGLEGRLNRKFISSTKKALKEIASVTDQLKKSFDFPPNGSSGISRIAAHLQLLHHQCVVLATRPLLFSLLKTRLDKITDMPTISGSTKTLLNMCIESSQHILAVLERLREQHLLESFLPFDLEAAFVAGMVLLIAPYVETEPTATLSPWIEVAYSILDELIIQGLLPAEARKSELQQLQKIFQQIPQAVQNELADDQQTASPQQNMMANVENDASNFAYEFIEDALWRTTFTADDLMNVADTLDLDGIDWMTTGSNSAGQDETALEDFAPTGATLQE